MPYIDLTTIILGVGFQRGKITFAAREESAVLGTEEVLRTFGKLNINPIKYTIFGTSIKFDMTLFYNYKLNNIETAMNSLREALTITRRLAALESI